MLTNCYESRPARGSLCWTSAPGSVTYIPSGPEAHVPALPPARLWCVHDRSRTTNDGLKGARLGLGRYPDTACKDSTEPIMKQSSFTQILLARIQEKRKYEETEAVRVCKDKDWYLY